MNLDGKLSIDRVTSSKRLNIAIKVKKLRTYDYVVRITNTVKKTRDNELDSCAGLLSQICLRLASAALSTTTK